MKVFYDDRMVARSVGFSPSTSKPKHVVDDWIEHGMPIDVVTFQAATSEDLEAPHDASFVNGILAGRIANGHGSYRKAVARSTLWTVGSVHAAAVEVMSSGAACSPSSGFHHAAWNEKGAFCTFNCMMVTAVRLLNDGLADRVGIVDYDYHFGDGTDDIIRRLHLEDSVIQVNGDMSADASTFFDSTEDDFQELQDADIILYQAGADMHIEDPRGGILTTDELRERDEIVFRWCHRSGFLLCGALQEATSESPMGASQRFLKSIATQCGRRLKCSRVIGRETPCGRGRSVPRQPSTSRSVSHPPTGYNPGD